MRLTLVAAGLLSGLLLHLALPPGPAPWLGWLALVPLLLALEWRRPDGRRAGLWLALPFGLLFGILSFRWMLFLDPAADVTVPGIMIPATLLWCLYLCLYPWLFVRLMVGARRRLGGEAFLAAPFLWTLLEWLRGSGTLAFSWIHISQTQAAPGGYLAPAGWVGGLGLGFLMVLAQASLAALVAGRRRRLAGATLAATAAVLALGALPGHRESERVLNVAALQGNVALADKWASHYRMENLRVFRELSREAVDRGAGLIVWPETAFPVNLLWDRQAEQALRQAARRLDTEILTGFQGLAPAPGGSYAYRNSAGLVGANGALEGAYSKVHLLPFGEEIPLADLLAPGLEIDLGQSNFTPGPGPRVLDGRRCRLAVFICYEMGFARTVREAAGAGAELLVNITNDGWFGHPVAMELHAALSPMRAAENGVPVVRCGNSGVTALYDARGRELARLPTNTRDLLTGGLHLPARASFYARHGGWALPLATLLYGAMLVWRLSVAISRKGSAAAR